MNIVPFRYVLRVRHYPLPGLSVCELLRAAPGLVVSISPHGEDMAGARAAAPRVASIDGGGTRRIFGIRALRARRLALVQKMEKQAELPQDFGRTCRENKTKAWLNLEIQTG